MIEQVSELSWLEQIVPPFFHLRRIHVAESYTKHPQFYKQPILEIAQIRRTFESNPSDTARHRIA